MLLLLKCLKFHCCILLLSDVDVFCSIVTLLLFVAQHSMMVLIMLLAPKTVDYFKNVFIRFGIVTIAAFWG